MAALRPNGEGRPELQLPEPLRRTGALLVAPRAEWARIAEESPTPRKIYARHILVLAAIGPAAGLLNALVAGAPALPALAAAALGYGASIAAVELLAWAVGALAPAFGARFDRSAALRLAAYASTAAWLSRIVLIAPFPWLAALGLVGSLYSFVLLGLGLPRLAEIDERRARLFLAALIALMLAVNIAAFLLWRLLIS